MIVLDDVSGVATAFAEDVQSRLEALGVYRRESAEVAPARDRRALPKGRKESGPSLANMCSIHVVRSALYRSTLAPGGARYDALETAALGGR